MARIFVSQSVGSAHKKFLTISTTARAARRRLCECLLPDRTDDRSRISRRKTYTPARLVAGKLGRPAVAMKVACLCAVALFAMFAMLAGDRAHAQTQQYSWVSAATNQGFSVSGSWGSPEAATLALMAAFPHQFGGGLAYCEQSNTANTCTYYGYYNAPTAQSCAPAGTASATLVSYCQIIYTYTPGTKPYDAAPLDIGDTVQPGTCGGSGQPNCPVQSSSKDPGPACDKGQQGQCGDPIVMAIGNKVRQDTDFVAPGNNSLKFQRYYNSTFAASSATNFAQGWMHNYAMSITTTSSTSAVVSRPDGKAYTFNLTSGTWTPDPDVSDTLVQLTSGSTVTGWHYTSASDDSMETYDGYGNLSSIAYREGTTVTLAYSSGTNIPTFPAPLLSATDSFGKSLTFNTNASGQTMTDPNGEIYTYTPGSVGTLSSVTYPDQTSKSYLYNESSYTGGSNFPLALTGVTDENNSRYDSTWYAPNGAAIETALAGGVGNYTLTNTLDSTGRIQSVAMLDPLGATRGRGFTSSVGRNRLSSVSQPAANGQPSGSESYSFDVNGNVIQSNDLNGNVECSVFDLTRNLETGRVEGMAPGSTCPANISTYVPAAGTVQRKILTQYHSIWHLAIERAEPLKITTWTYNGDGGVYCAPTTAKIGVNPIGVVCLESEQATTDATGGAGFSATASGSPRVWSYTYNNFGQVLTANGPRTDVSDVTTYAYYTCTTGAKCGQVNTISNALGQVTTFLTYDGNGNPLTLSDPNAVVTTLTYDGRQRLKTQQVGTETTSYTYYLTGLLNLVTRADGSTVQMSYDAAHRLTKITDGLGNYIQYTLDELGNHTADNAYDPTNTLRRTHTRVFNTLSQLYQDINAANTAAVTTTLGYDAQGNQTSIDAPLSRNTAKTYDALNRLSQITDPNSGIALVGYDANDNLASVKDPRSLITSYSHNGFGDLATLVSPDTGTTTDTYDSGGNLKTATDARGAVATYSYDALNRLTQQAYTDQTINFTYDAGTNGKGRLTGASDASHALSWAYDTHGRVTGAGQTVATVTKSVGYGYTNDDLTSIVTPSGQTLTYVYTNHQITSIAINGTTLLNGVTYFPYGPASGWIFASGAADSRTYDTDGNVTVILSQSDPINYGYDNAFRITSITDTGNTPNSWTLGYDVLDRITSATKTGTTYGWTYDANSNRLTQTGTTASTFTPSTTSNRLNTVTGGLARTYSYDAAGNTKTYANLTYTYNQRGRASSVTVGSATSNYIYSALGQLIEKTVGSTTTLLMYDIAGHLLGEYTNTGALIQETIWMGDIPVATLRPSGTTIATYYVHTDQLNAPRKVTLPSNANLVWRWDADPYGTAAANQNPSGLGTFVYNLRFPGQYYQAETGLNYNYTRDYDPATGRYTESDSAGLRGGINTYSYVRNNPISRSDPRGLYDCTYSISAHSMNCMPDQAGHPNFSSSNYVSGNNNLNSCQNCQNNPGQTGVQNHGPIPVGTYNIGGITVPGGSRRRLAPDPVGRSNLELHGCPNPATCSDGCIGATTNADRDLLNQDLSLEEGQNTLTVVP